MTQTTSNVVTNISEISETSEHSFFTTRQETINWLEYIGVDAYEIDDNLVVNVLGDVNLKNKNLDYLPVQFGTVTGNFYVNKNNLITLKGSPYVVEGNLDCSENNLVNLDHFPQKLGKSCFCNNNKLTTLEGCIDSINGKFYCGNNELPSLVHGPQTVTDNYQCFKNKLEDMAGVASVIGGTLYCSNNPLKTLDGIRQVNQHLSCPKTELNLDSVNWSDIKIDGWITLSNKSELDYLNRYVTEFDDIEMPYAEFLRLRGLNGLNEKLNLDLAEENYPLAQETQSPKKLKI